MSNAQYEQLDIDQGVDFVAHFYVERKDGSDPNLNTATARASLKKNTRQDSADATFLTGIDFEDDYVSISLTNEQTSALTKKTYVYDVFLDYVDSDGDVTSLKLVWGDVDVMPAVTR